jgi:hypothetical protein
MPAPIEIAICTRGAARPTTANQCSTVAPLIGTNHNRSGDASKPLNHREPRGKSTRRAEMAGRATKS